MQAFPLVPMQDFSLKAFDDSGTRSIENTGLQYMTISLILMYGFLSLLLLGMGIPQGSPDKWFFPLCLTFPDNGSL